jgi:uncharacterized protein (TIGR02452 family)
MGKYQSIAQENEAIISAGGYTREGVRVDLADAVASACAGVRSYDPAATKQLLSGQAYRSDTGGDDTALEVTGESSTAAAERLVRQEGATGVAVLNFASARNPGGGYLGGARAQEEDLCRSSALYTTLLEAPDYYDAHRADRDVRYSHRVIYSPDVPVYRDHRSRLLDGWHPVSFLTSAAPNAGALRRRDPGAVSGLRELIAERAARVLAVAAHHEVRVLVLGAWGCGVFRNDPADVAGVWAFHLGDGGAFRGRFERVVFAVYDTAPGQPTLATFEDAFSAAAGRAGA